jgi:hypothetical protein
MITPLGGKTASAPKVLSKEGVTPETAPLGVARRSFGKTKLLSSCLEGAFSGGQQSLLDEC